MPKKYLFTKNFFQNKWTLRIVAVIIALVMWVYVTEAQNTTIERALDVPLEFHNIPANMAVSDSPSSIRVRVQGKRDVVNDLLPADITVYVDLKSASIGQNMAKVQTEKPNKVTIISVNPVQVAVELEKVVNVQKPIAIQYAGDAPADGYQKLNAVLDPSQVIISGPESKITAIDSVYVKTDVSGLTMNYSQTLPVYVCDQEGNMLNNWLTLSPSKINVLVPIVTTSAYKIAPISASLSGKPATGYMMTRTIIDPDIVTVYGEQADLDKLSYVYTAPININGARNDITTKAALVTTDGLNYSINNEVTVIIKIEKITTRTLDNILVSLENQNNHYTYTLKQNVAKVTVTGPKSVVENLQANQINLQADADGLKPGKYNIYLTGDLPTGISSMKIEPETIDLQINKK